eukprot:Transcript_14887.p1 GENE.Transcript_14887~~Transcript_14887.p1  ORF type:complete len:331 (-),score=45.33 Transcript_14887:79-1071(-)
MSDAQQAALDFTISCAHSCHSSLLRLVQERHAAQAAQQAAAVVCLEKAPLLLRAAIESGVVEREREQSERGILAGELRDAEEQGAAEHRLVQASASLVAQLTRRAFDAEEQLADERRAWVRERASLRARLVLLGSRLEEAAAAAAATPAALPSPADPPRPADHYDHMIELWPPSLAASAPVSMAPATGASSSAAPSSGTATPPPAAAELGGRAAAHSLSPSQDAAAVAALRASVLQAAAEAARPASSAPLPPSATPSSPGAVRLAHLLATDGPSGLPYDCSPRAASVPDARRGSSCSPSSLAQLAAAQREEQLRRAEASAREGHIRLRDL